MFVVGASFDDRRKEEFLFFLSALSLLSNSASEAAKREEGSVSARHLPCRNERDGGKKKHREQVAPLLTFLLLFRKNSAGSRERRGGGEKRRGGKGASKKKKKEGEQEGKPKSSPRLGSLHNSTSTLSSALSPPRHSSHAVCPLHLGVHAVSSTRSRGSRVSRQRERPCTRVLVKRERVLSTLQKRSLGREQEREQWRSRALSCSLSLSSSRPRARSACPLPPLPKAGRRRSLRALPAHVL